MNNQITVLTWSDIANHVKKISPKLAEIIDEINPSKNHKFVKVNYGYGAHILHNGQFMLPTAYQETAPLNHHKLPSHINKLLDYSSVPIGLVLENGIELYAERKHDTIPYRVLNTGSSFGVWETLDTHKKVTIRQLYNWSISAGARSTFLLPKVTDSSAHKRLKKKFSIRYHAPTSLDEHWHIFRQIVNKYPNKDWHVSILYFTKEWFENINSLRFSRLNHYLLQEAVEQYSNWINKAKIECLWDDFMEEIKSQKLSTNHGLINTLLHLIAIANGDIPGYRPTGSEQLLLPTQIIQEAYIDGYGLSKYMPTIMQPFMLPVTTNSVCYYSLQHPKIPNAPVRINYATSAIRELEKLAELIDIFTNLQQNSIIGQSSEFYDRHTVINYDLFHNKIYDNDLIKNTKLMIHSDPGFLQSAYAPNNVDKKFPYNCRFMNGCVRISSDIYPTEAKYNCPPHILNLADSPHSRIRTS